MRIISVKYLRDFGELNPDAQQPLKAWYAEAKTAVWKTPQEIKNLYRNASFVGSNRVVFDIKGDDYRLITAMAFRFETICIKFIGTHAEYERIDAQPLKWSSPMDIRPIRTEAEYKVALDAVLPYFDQEPGVGTEDADRFEVMLALIQVYEAKNHPIDPPNAIEAIKFRMEQQGLSVKDLEPYIGQLNRVYEVLNHKRPLTLRMIRRIHEGLGIPAEVLIRVRMTSVLRSP